MERSFPGATPTFGGNSSSVSSQLNGASSVVSLTSNQTSFAALLENGSVITWGFAGFGGDSSAVSNELDGTVRVT